MAAVVSAIMVLSSTIVLSTRVAAAATLGEGVPAPARINRATSGYWLGAGDGGIFSFGDADFRGSKGGVKLNKPIVGMSATPTGDGYWLVASDGGLFAFGDASFFGSTGAMSLNKPIVGMAATPTGKGYWLVASDGGLFAFGDAGFFGSTGAMSLNKPIVGMAATPSSAGYWLVATDGGIFSFGDARFAGSTGDKKLNAPIVAMGATSTGAGYWLAATDGGIFTFGDAVFYGSTGSIKLNRPIVAMTPTAFGMGYWLVASDGGIFTFGDAPFLGSTGDLKLTSPVLGIAPRARRTPIGRAAFYYPWWGTTSENGAWRHWDDPTTDGVPGPFSPPDDIASNFYPARGPYSSSNPNVLDQQMTELAAAGVDRIVISWWGRGTYEDDRLPAVAAAARAHGITPAIHLEPYAGRTPDSAAADVDSIGARVGITDYWVYAADSIAAESWRTLTDRFPGDRFWGHSQHPADVTGGKFAAYATRAGFAGIYTYDVIVYSPFALGRMCAQARARNILCSPSVGAGYDDRRIRTADGSQRSRDGGSRYDAYWRGALVAGADLVSITSYNEWHEGTQIEPAVPKCNGSTCYDSFEGAYGLTGADASTAYLARTRQWADATARMP
jgi:hypothetical protein